MALLGRDTLVTGPSAAGPLLLETFQGKECLGEPYVYAVDLLSADHNIPPDSVLGQPLTIRIKLDAGGFRYFHGEVAAFAKTGISIHHTRYHAILTPTLSKFAYTRDCRVFNTAPTSASAPASNQTALSIVLKVLAARDLTLVASGAIDPQHVYRKREYCVQYRESDLNFVHRLLEEEGIYYFFKHEDGKHTLVLTDSGVAHKTVPGYETVPYFSKHKAHGAVEHFWSLQVSGALYPGLFKVLRGYDYTEKRPKQPLFGKRVSEEKAPGQEFENYDYPGALSAEPEAMDEALVREQRGYAEKTLIEVEGSTVGLGVGDLVTLGKPLSMDGEINPFWSEDDFKKQFLITSASYHISVNQYETGDVAKSDDPFRAHYTLLDSKVQYRAARGTRKPRIEGPQTALVVGPDGQEIWTDKFGRVLVQFDWDRLGERNEKSSCWVRVAQAWAGASWGALHIPRIGHEVIVEYLDGDPDRPIITGGVYNADNLPPYVADSKGTQSGIKSRSTKGGTDQNFNEIRFEDLKDKEELHMQAERDMSTLVKRNQSTSVGADRSVSVGGNQSTTVTKNETQTYKAERAMTVAKTNKDVITGAHTGIYHAGRTETVEHGDTLTVKDSNKTVTVVGAYDITVKDHLMVTKADTSMTIDDNFVVAASGKVDLHNPGTSVVGEGTKLALMANSELTITCGAASISMKSDGTIEITGSKVKIGNANNNAAFEPAGTTINGVKITTAAVGMQEITGALIKVG